MPKPRSEEQFPLLLFLVGDNQEISQNNRRLFSRGRFDRITSGASAIITEWPNYVSSCWATALICGVTLFILTLLLTSCMTLEYNRRFPRCVSNYPLDNQTIHLVHTSRRWTPTQLELVENITHAFPNYTIHITMIKDKFFKRNEIVKHVSNMNINIANHNRSSKLKKDVNGTHNNQTSIIQQQSLFHKIKTFPQLLETHPNILVTYSTYSDIFENTPLLFTWGSLNEQMKIFAVRILQMFQYGGMSFDLMEFNPAPKKFKNATSYILKKLQKLIRHGNERYENADPSDVSIDQNGVHMECKTPCHAFFAAVLKKLKRAHQMASPRSVLNGPIYTFCLDGVIDKAFCHSKNFILF